MPDEEHVNKIKQGAIAWNKWREENPGIRPDLSGAYLTAINPDPLNLIQLNLRGADLSRAKLTAADFIYSDLTEADLTGAICSHIKLDRAILKGAVLSGALLISAEIADADLTNAKLDGTDLSFADLSGTNLSGAVLSNSKAWRTIFRKTNLDGADLTGAEVAWATFVELDLSSVKGLESVNHKGPSSIGMDTIYKSKGQIPDVFLRGAGILDDFITYAQRVRRDAPAYNSCFISYSHQDKPFAARLHKSLIEKGIPCWMDEFKLLPGQDMYDEISRAIEFYDKVLLCCSSHSLTSWWVDAEMNAAFAKEQKLTRQSGKKTLVLIPLDLDGYMFSQQWQSGKAPTINSRLAASFVGWEQDNEKFEHQLERLILSLRTGGE